MIVVGIETSCDETAVAVVEDGMYVRANVVFSSMDLHTVYGGVVPEIAARSHVESMIPVVEQALNTAFDDDDPWSRVDAIAVTYGAGLGGSLLVGVMTARTLAIIKNKPLYAINHVEAHVYANFLTGVKSDSISKDAAAQDSILGGKTYQFPSLQPQFPMLALIVSGGHSQLALFQGHFDYTLLGRTRDDAVGEAFDKVAKILGLPYPGGPSVSKAAENGDPHKYRLPKARLEGESEVLSALRAQRRTTVTESDTLDGAIPPAPSSNFDFSFSGLKTAVLRLAQKEIGEDFTFPSFKIAPKLTDTQRCDIAASFQRIALETLVDKTIVAYEEFAPKSVVIAGGVAASRELRRQLEQRLQQSSGGDAAVLVSTDDSLTTPVIEYPDMKLCTDNGAMIATLGCYKAMHGQETTDPYSLDIQPNLSM